MPAERALGVPADSELLARIAERDLSALATLYDLHAASLLSFLTRCQRQDAEDILQSTFLRVAQVASSFDSNAASARPWLFGIALRILRERRRSFARFTAFLTRFGQSSGAKTSASSTLREPGTDGHRLDLERALWRLSEAKRSVLLLRDVEGFSAHEVAGILKIPIGTVWTQLHHARKEMREILEDAP